MAVSAIPPSSGLVDQQFIKIQGPDGLVTGYQFDAQQRALYFKESEISNPNFHGSTHIVEDPIPTATCDTPGLMHADDKCKLDALLSTRLGVLGFQGAGFPDDGGWLHGDIILAAGTEFISLERIGNVIRFTVDSPIPLNCNCEECQQIFMVQDETDIASIRPPTCGGKLPGVNLYGEMKIYLFPESTIADPNNTASTLNNKANHPALIFKRYDDTIAPGTAEFEVILKRDNLNSTVTEIGWAMTPGATGVPEMRWFMGKNNDGSQIEFELEPNSEPGLLGSLLYNGHLITKKMGVITGYTGTILETNQYTVREWSTDVATAVGDSFTAKNNWHYTNPGNALTGANAQSLTLDSTIDLLPIGTLVDLWAFKIGEVAGEPILRHYFSKQPTLNPNNVWAWAAEIQFGDVAIAREEILPSHLDDDKDAAIQVSAIRDIERSAWGLTGYDDPLIWFDIASTAGTEAADISKQHRAVIDTDLPGLRVDATTDIISDFSERPVWLWNRKSFNNSITRLDVGRPDNSNFVPFDVTIRSKIDEFETRYMQVSAIDQLNGINYIKVTGVHFHDLPPFGSVRVISPGNDHNIIYNYARKYMFHDGDPQSVILVSDSSNDPYLGTVGNIIELLHQEYNSPAVRVEFGFDALTGLVELQFKVGILDMGLPYEEDIPDDVDDYVRGLSPGYAVSAVYSQAGTYTGIGTQPSSSTAGFVVYDGGSQIGGLQDEYWNRLEIMVRDDQIWIWWNGLLIPPNPSLSAGLPTPVSVDTPYYPILVDPNQQFGKTGLRMWPGARLRRIDIRSQISSFSEFSYRQLDIS